MISLVRSVLFGSALAIAIGNNTYGMLWLLPLAYLIHINPLLLRDLS